MMVNPNQAPMFCKRAKDRFAFEELLQQGKRKGAEQRTAQVAEATQNDHDQHLTRQVPAHQLGIDEAVLDGEQKAREAGNARPRL